MTSESFRAILIKPLEGGSRIEMFTPNLNFFTKSGGAESMAVGRISHVAVVFNGNHGNHAIDATVAVGLADTLPPTLFPAYF